MNISAQSGQYLVKNCEKLRIGTVYSKPTVRFDSVAAASQAVSLNLQMVQTSLKEVEVPYYYYYLLPFHLKLHPNGIK